MATFVSRKGYSSARPASFFSVLLLWSFAFTPSVMMLLLILSHRGHLPFYDSWAFVKQYKDWCEGHYSWGDFFAPHNMHPSAVGKAIWFAVMEWCRGDVGLLPIVTWLLALVVSMCVRSLSRPLWRDDPVWGAGLMFLVNLSSFTLAMGGTWLWEFVFQNAIPGACLMTGLWALSAERVPWWRWLLALLTSVVAAFSFGTGFIVGFLLIPAVWFAKRDGNGLRRPVIVVAWLFFSVFVTWLALVFCIPHVDMVMPTGGVGRLDDFIERPWDAAQYILALCGHTLGQGTAFEPVTGCAVLGLLLMVIFFVCFASIAKTRNSSRIRAAWPWVAMILWSIINAMAICLGRWRVSLDTALAHRYGQFMLFMVIGVLMLVCSIVRQGNGRLPIWLRRTSVPLLVMLLMAHVISWKEGFDDFRIFQRMMEREKAALTFARVLPPQTALQRKVDENGSLARLTVFLQERGRLHGVEFAPDVELSRLRQKKEISDKWAHWELFRSNVDDMQMRGTAGLSRDVLETPDLVLITATTSGSSEKIIALAALDITDDFFQRSLRRRKYYDHYFGWGWKVNRELLAQGTDTVLHAYALDLDGRNVRRISGEAVIAAGGK